MTIAASSNRYSNNDLASQSKSQKSTQEQSRPEQFLSFKLPANLAILPTQKLTEVLTLTPQQIIPIPDLDRQIMGVCNWRGEVLWLVDLNAILNGDPLPTLQGTHYSAIILNHDGQTIGLVVSQVTQMVWCSSDDIQGLPRTQQLPPSPFIQGYWISPQSETFLVLNAAEIFASLKG
jgi:positive phototaxis protein PixI